MWLFFWGNLFGNWGGATITVKVTKYGTVGDVIEGTCSGTLSDGFTTKNITEGKFRIIRATDDTLPPYYD